MVLRFFYVLHPHINNVLANIHIDQCLFQYNLKNKISSIVVNNCTRCDSMMDILLGKFKSNSLIVGINSCICGPMHTFQIRVWTIAWTWLVMELREFVIVLLFEWQLPSDRRSLRIQLDSWKFNPLKRFISIVRLYGTLFVWRLSLLWLIG